MRAESPLELSAALITRSLNPPYSFLLGKDSRCRFGGGKQLTEAGVNFIHPIRALTLPLRESVLKRGGVPRRES